MDGTKVSPAKGLSKDELNAIRAALPADKQAQLDKLIKSSESKSRRKTEDEIRKEYPQVVEGSLRWNESAGKQEVEITCMHDGCDEPRTVFTSDLFQVRMCNEHRKEQRAEARKARVAERDKLIEAGKAALAAQKAGEADQS